MWRLRVVKGAELADKLVKEVTLPQPFTAGSRFVIGRDPANPWVLTDRTLAISARHCEIVSTAAGLVLRDLSTNGTFVNAQASRLAGDHLLADGDQFELGPFTVAVIGPPLPVLGAVRPAPVAPPAAPARTPGLAETAPQRPPPMPMPMRGGDPAAMLAAGGGFERVGLTEILRAAPKADDSNVDVTKIRLAPAKRAPVPAPAPAPATQPAGPASKPDPLAQAAGLASAALQALHQRHAGAVPATALQPLLAALHRGEDPVAAVRRWATGLGIPPPP